MTLQTEDTPTIEVHIPDYDTSFVYRLVFGEICEFSDNNLLDLSHRAELTELVSVVNARLLELNRLRRQASILPELVKALEAMVEIICESDRDITVEDCDDAKRILTRANEIKL